VPQHGDKDIRESGEAAGTRKGRERARHILETAVEVFLDQGYARFTLRAVAEAVGRVARAGRKPDLRAVLDTLEDDATKEAAVDIQTRAERESENRLAAYLNDCLRRALQDRAMQDRTLDAARETKADTDDLQSLVDSIRTTTKQFGDDRRRMPSRPGPR